MSISPSQIIYLEHGSTRLYAEAIQIVEARQLCWARPTLLIQNLPTYEEPARGLADRQAAIATAAANPEASNLSFYGLEDWPDLIWPAALFSIAFDVDFFALLVRLKQPPNNAALERSCQADAQQLSEFIRSFWLARKDAFYPTDCASI